jgi:asparagine synthase (glutamine-hydrolysing)
MCGIAGLFCSRILEDSPKDVLGEMLNVIKHRGPDDSGLWSDDVVGVYLGHRRLSILDLSPTGHQPMQSAGDRFVIVFNGEIYNHKEIRNNLSAYGVDWRGTSDTETLINAIELLGLEEALSQCVGMYAFALWDKQEGELILCRDRMGEKPLYYGFVDGTFVFASELKAIKCCPNFSSDIDSEALSSYFRLGYVPAPYSIYKGLFKLPAASYLRLKSVNLRSGLLPEPKKYWELRNGLNQQPLNLNIDEDEYVLELERLISNSVSQQMLSDVPLGAFLSGGIDSSLIVSLLQSHSNVPVRTFTIGFKEDAYDEASHARAIAKHLGTEHTEMYVNSQDALGIIPSLSTIYDEPFADSSAIPTLLLSRLTKKSVSVSLSGDGGDELFYGYRRYDAESKLWQKLELVPTYLRPVIRTILNGLRVFGGRSQLQDKLFSLSGILGAKSFEEFYVERTSHWKNGQSLPKLGLDGLSVADSMMVCDLLRYLPDDILVKVDRASMSCGLESRVPMLDYRVVEFAQRLPFRFKSRDGVNKWILKKILEKHLPRELFDRPKKGFGIPLNIWLKHDLREWAEDLLCFENLKSAGISDIKEVRFKWDAHLSGKRNFSHALWVLLSYLDWRRKNV